MGWMSRPAEMRVSRRPGCWVQGLVDNSGGYVSDQGRWCWVGKGGSMEDAGTYHQDFSEASRPLSLTSLQHLTIRQKSPRREKRERARGALACVCVCLSSSVRRVLLCLYTRIKNKMSWADRLGRKAPKESSQARRCSLFLLESNKLLSSLARSPRRNGARTRRRQSRPRSGIWQSVSQSVRLSAVTDSRWS